MRKGKRRNRVKMTGRNGGGKIQVGRREGREWWIGEQNEGREYREMDREKEMEREEMEERLRKGR